MQVTYTSAAAPGGINEDYVVTGPQWVAVLDGATPRAEVESGCIHDVPWLVQHLGSELSRLLNLTPAIPLPDALAATISEVRGAHEATCDLSNPDSPSATVLILRWLEDELNYLILGDSPLLLDIDGAIQVITDERAARLPFYSAESVRAHRNQPHGFWVASTVPEAAYRAVTGSKPLRAVRRAALLSDGASRYAERLALGKWEDLFDLLTQPHGPVELVRRVRAAEREQLPLESVEPNGRRVKRHDDATAVLVEFENGYPTRG